MPQYDFTYDSIDLTLFALVTRSYQFVLSKSADLQFHIKRDFEYQHYVVLLHQQYDIIVLIFVL